MFLGSQQIQVKHRHPVSSGLVNTMSTTRDICVCITVKWSLSDHGSCFGQETKQTPFEPFSYTSSIKGNISRQYRDKSWQMCQYAPPPPSMVVPSHPGFIFQITTLKVQIPLTAVPLTLSCFWSELESKTCYSLCDLDL